MDNQARILNVLEDNNFGTVKGAGRKLRLRNLTSTSVNLEGGKIGARYSVQEGLVVWNLGLRNSGKEITLGELVNIEKELNKIFNKKIN